MDLFFSLARQNRKTLKLTKIEEMADSPELSGLLYKRRGGFGKIMPNAWQYRFFTISKDGILQYFDTEIPDTDSLDSRARGRLDLKAVNYEVSVEPIEGAPTQYSIQIIVPSEETWKMCAYGKEDQQRWIKAIEKYQHEKLSKSANVVASYTSDDDGERMKRSATKSLRENSSAGTIVADPSTKSDLVASPRSSTVSNVVKQNVATENVNPPQAPKLQRRGSMNKRRLKLAGSKGIVNQELGELLLVITILNICIVGIVHSGSFFRKILYWVVANFVIAHTLSLRSERSKRVSRDHTAQIPSNSHISGSQSPTSKVEDIPVVIEAETIPIEGTETVEAEKLVAITGQKPVPGKQSNFYFVACLTFLIRSNIFEDRGRPTTCSSSYLVCRRLSFVQRSNWTKLRSIQKESTIWTSYL